MKSNELRIGNFVRYAAETQYVHAITRTGVEVDGLAIKFEDVSPIDLTEEWLLKFGFDLSKSNKHIYITYATYGIFSVVKYDKSKIVEEYKHLNHDDYIVVYNQCADECSFYNFKYVHQIQNIYFALTGEELTLK